MRDRHLDTLYSLGTSTGLSDDELLKRFLERRERSDRASRAAEVAFEAIVRRHGPMVLGVCRRYLDDPNDVEDAFQAVFIVLFRRARAIRIGDSLGPWLHGVSRRIAARARAAALRRNARESLPCVEPLTDPSSEDRRRDVSEALDEELDRLPARYRIPIILCHLEGLTYQEAARRLDCPVGTIGVRLLRGRELLKARLTRRGSVLPGGLWAVTLDPTVGAIALPPSLVDATLRAASRNSLGAAMTAGPVSASIVSLSDGLLRSMFMNKVKAATATFLSVGLLLASVGSLLGQGAVRQGAGPAIAPQNTAPQRAVGTGDRLHQVRGLIYYFRTYRVFCRDEEWARTIRELAAIGKDAVPELVAELDRTDRDATLRSLAFTLRAIGDPRAVPALIRAIPKALRSAGSDCGVQILDHDLRAFMHAHQHYKDRQPESVVCGRPVNEILTALERITGHGDFVDAAGNDVRHVFLGGTSEQQARQRASFDQCRQRWEAWWLEHRQEFVTKEELRSVELPKRDKDLVEIAGVGRYGVLFPTGPDVRLGPVRMLRLSPLDYANGKSHLDFDTGRTFALYEGIKAADWGGPDEFGQQVSAWYRRNGVDARYQGGIEGNDLQLWLVNDNRWDTIEAEVRRDEPLPLGREATDTMARFDKSWTDFKPGELATFLFTTREGGRGIVQVFPKDPDVDRCRARYRMWMTAEAKPSTRAAAEPVQGNQARTPFGQIVTTTLEPPADGWECLLDLQTGRKERPPDFLRPQEMANTFSLTRDDRFAQWCRDRDLDLLRRDLSEERKAEAVTAEGLAAPASPSRPELTGLEMTVARIQPQSFEGLAVEEAREILGRRPDQKLRAVWIGSADHLTERPDTFAFHTREGTVGLLQMQADAKDPSKLTIRYRLEPRDGRAGGR